MPAGNKGHLKRVILQQNKMKYNGLPRETKIGSKNVFEKSGVNLQCSIEEWERLLLRVI